MKRLIAIFACSTLLSAAAAAQTGSTPVPGVFSGITLALAQPPQPVSSVTGVVEGNPGPRILYYWIVTNALIGSSAPSGPWIVPLGPNTLSASNGVSLSWSAAPGAITYDVLRTTTPAPPVGACNCAVATGLAGTTTTDQSNTLAAYTVAQFDPNSLAWNLSSQSSAAGVSKFSLAVGNSEKWSIDSTGVQTSAGMNAKSIEQVRYADQFPGSDIGAKINAAISDCPASGCTVRVPAGSYSYSTTILVNAPLWIRGDGALSSTLTYTGTGDAIDVEAGSAPPYRHGGIAGIALVGNSNTNAVGIHQINTIGFSYPDVTVESFTGSNGAGIWLDNENTTFCPTCSSGFNERTNLDGASLFQNTANLKLTREGTTSTNSFEYTWARGLHLQINNGQTGIMLVGEDATHPISLQHSDFDFFANICLSNPTGAAGTVVSLTNYALWYQGFVHSAAEQSCGTTQGVYWSVDSHSYVDAWGDYIGIASNLANSIAAGGTFQFGLYGSYVMAGNANGQVGVGGFNSGSLKAPFGIGGNTSSNLAGYFDLDLAGDYAGAGQLNETIQLGGDAGAVAGLGFDFGSSIQHPLSWSYVGDTHAFDWFAKINPSTPISGSAGAFLSGPASSPSWAFWGNAFCFQTSPFTCLNAAPAVSGTPALTSQLPLSGTTPNIGGSSLAAGACVSGTVAVAGSTTAMAVSVSPAADPGAGFAWEGWVSAAGTVTVRVCNVTPAALTPAAEPYNVRVIQ